MSSETFETLDEDVQVLFESLSRKLNTKLAQCHGEEKKQTAAQIERGIDEAKQFIFEMEAEARSAPGHFRMQMMATVRSHNDTANKLAQQLKSLMKSETFGSSQNQSSGVDETFKRTVIQGTQALERTSQSIYRSTQVALETEEIGTSVIGELGTQRETLTRARERLVDTDMELGRSRRILTSLYRGAITNKVILIVVILLELAILSGLVYYKFFSTLKL